MAESHRMTAEEVVAKLMSDEHADFLCESLRWMVEQLMEVEVGELIGAELDEITHRWEAKGVFALHADITNCVRHGDVLAIESWDPLAVRLTESKASGRGASPAQAERLERVSQLSTTVSSAVNGAALPLQPPRISYETNLAQLQPLIVGARQQTHAFLARHAPTSPSPTKTNARFGRATRTVSARVGLRLLGRAGSFGRDSFGHDPVRARPTAERSSGAAT